MSKIRSKNTKIEKLVFKELRKRKIYFQKHHKAAFGHPDVAIPRLKAAVFIDGDFWHGYRFSKSRSRLPEKYWVGKIEKNIERDKNTRRRLRRAGWRVLRIWEHELEKNKEKSLNKIISFLKYGKTAIKRNPKNDIG